MNRIEYIWNKMIICDDCLEEMRINNEAYLMTSNTITVNVQGECELCLIKELSEEGILLRKQYGQG